MQVNVAGPKLRIRKVVTAGQGVLEVLKAGAGRGVGRGGRRARKVQRKLGRGGRLQVAQPSFACVFANAPRQLHEPLGARFKAVAPGHCPHVQHGANGDGFDCAQIRFALVAGKLGEVSFSDFAQIQAGQPTLDQGEVAALDA